jgi:hypothetical protein
MPLWALSLILIIGTEPPGGAPRRLVAVCQLLEQVIVPREAWWLLVCACVCVCVCVCVRVVACVREKKRERERERERERKTLCVCVWRFKFAGASQLLSNSALQALLPLRSKVFIFPHAEISNTPTNSQSHGLLAQKFSRRRSPQSLTISMLRNPQSLTFPMLGSP